MGRIFFAILIGILLHGGMPSSLRGSVAVAAQNKAVHKAFVPPSVLESNVNFWVSIYSQYDTSQGVIHDAKYIDKIYEVLDFRKIRGSRREAIRNAKNKWREALLSLHRRKGDFSSDLSPEEKRLLELYSDVRIPHKFLDAAHRKRLRFQQGQKDHFEQGLKYSGKYLARMEAIFKKHGLPKELTRLPFVESSFNLKAVSKVGASGIWQFMPSTGRLFVRVDDQIDERNDPIRATEAAALLLKMNYDSLGKWPLAVTAYNHGRKSMMRAVRQIGSTEFSDILERYRVKKFGFASSNFYACLLAAIEVERHAEKYFGKIQREAPLSANEVVLSRPQKLSELARKLKVSQKALKSLNPALSKEIIQGKQPVPADYRFRLPTGKRFKKASVIQLIQGKAGQKPPKR